MAKDPIKRANNGTYYFRANLGYDSVTGKQIQKYRSGFSTKKEARAEYSKLIIAAEDELAMEKKQPSFKQFIEEIYLPWYKTQVKESTYRNRLNTIEKHFKFFYRKKVNEIEPIHVQTWQLKLAKDYSPNYVRIIQGMLSLAFDRAIILGLAKKNPARMVGNIKYKKVKVDFWTLEEFQKVISLLYKGDYYEHYLFICFWLLFTTGLRIGEAAALQWDDIDFESGLLSVTKTLYYKSMNEYKFVDPKTSASIRTVVLDEDTIRELKDWREVQKKVLKDCNFVLSYNGTPTSKTTLPRALEKLANLAGVHRIKIHALRHSHASLLISMGENPLIIKDRLGHEKIQTTLGTYGHLYPNSNFEVAKKLTGKLTYTPATESVADYTSNQFTAEYHKQVN
ncbi:tyrosine-type recombinase/integrase [Enterococcus faecium]|uniref:tyrosine-type recombinase/integrase n=1 Tax=Enterococcus faecium TaxID=1352 RepID=UPI00292DEE1F|nr:tyrosine-type recombinase/integrase [Enterococcus faecium]